jgi:hypothetical protein
VTNILRDRKQLDAALRLRNLEKGKAGANLGRATGLRQHAMAKLDRATAAYQGLLEQQHSARTDNQPINPDWYVCLLEAGLRSASEVQARREEFQKADQLHDCALAGFVKCRSRLRVVHDAVDDSNRQRNRNQEVDDQRENHEQYSRYHAGAEVA